MSGTHIRISNTRNCIVEVINHPSMDPNTWIVKVSKKFLFFFKKQTGSYWFYDKKIAMEYAEKYEC
jgi:hypothetical protein